MSPANKLMVLAALLLSQTAPCQMRDASVTIAEVAAQLAGRYENAAQVAQGKAAGETPPPQRMVITIEPTARKDWQLWRVHMDVEPAVAETAGSDTSLEAVWAMNVIRPAGKPLQFIPYTLKPSLDEASVKAAAFDRSDWLSLEACTLEVDLGKSRITAAAPPDEMCVAATMGLGGKRAFLPSWIEHEGDRLRVQLIYFGRPWRVDAHRVPTANAGN
ncbi:MAG: hypothetical protein ABSG30_03160 [Steroidobacteraceae bacterium]